MRIKHIIALTVSLAGAATFGQVAMASGSVASGAAVYSQNCGRCHNARPAEQFTKAEWSAIIPHMRVKGHMTKQESLDVEAFLDSTLTAEVAGGPAAKDSGVVSTDEGKTLVGNLGCQGCHAINGSGGQLGPNLNTTFKTKGDSFMMKKIANPKFNNPSTGMPKFPLTQSQIASIVKFIGDSSK